MQTRLQSVWDEYVQHVWKSPVSRPNFWLVQDTLGPGHRSDRWSQEHQASADLASETAEAIDELIALAVRSMVTASQAPPDVKLATLADP